MRICLIARNDFVADPRARALHASLMQAGHDVSLVATGRRSAESPEGAIYVTARRPEGLGLLGRVLRRMQPDALRWRLLDRALSATAAEQRPDIIYPTSAAAIPAATRAAGDRAVIVRDPRWPEAGPRDLVRLAPDRPELAVPAAGGGLPFHTPTDDRPASRPEEGRYAGQRIAIAYPKTDSNPGRYVEEALRRAGFEVLLFTRRVDTSELPEDLRALVFVEGPYPALEVSGPPVNFPVIYWAHHGEHHLAANLRMVKRYRADAVLLAHSWHLAHRFHVPVHRFPFGIDEYLFDASVPWEDRRFDVAMVGAHLREGGPYQRRQQIVREAERSRGEERTAFLENVTSAEMAAAYAQSRIIINEGGTRHFPITMRVFEAAAAGALLLTDPVPGLERILEPEREYLHIAGDLGTQIDRLLSDPSTSQVAARAHERARGHHTYDRRVDELVAIIEATEPAGRTSPTTPAADRPAGVLHDDVEVQRILTDAQHLEPQELPDREIWTTQQLRHEPQPGSYEAVVAHVDKVDDDPLLLAARRLLYLTGRCNGLDGFLDRHHPDASMEERGLVRRIDLGADSYSIKPHEIVET